MHTHRIEPPETRRPPDDAELSPAVVAPVGTFASGQSEHGSFRVAAAAEVGSFASGPAEDERWETA
jgi:hypothetical protein